LISAKNASSVSPILIISANFSKFSLTSSKVVPITPFSLIIFFIVSVVELFDFNLISYQEARK